MNETIGIIAGNGKFPVLVANEAKKTGCTIITAAIAGEADQPMEEYGDKVHRVDLGQLTEIIALFKSNGVNKVIMAGQVKHKQLFAGHKLDTLSAFILNKIADKRTDSILKMVADTFNRSGITILPSTSYLSHLMATEGLICGSIVNGAQKDIDFGLKIAKAISAMDIGQTICVKDCSVVAVEAMEGTDECILRAGKIAGAGITVIKVAKANQDIRFDVPVIGIRTMKSLAEVNAGLLVVEAGMTLIFDREEVIELASANNISVIGTKIKGRLKLDSR